MPCAQQAAPLGGMRDAGEGKRRQRSRDALAPVRGLLEASLVPLQPYIDQDALRAHGGQACCSLPIARRSGQRLEE